MSEEEGKESLDELLSKYRASGKVGAEAREYGISLIKDGVKLIDVCNAVEDRIRDLGCQPAFPTNISIGHIAAHYTSPEGDETTFETGQLVKLDVGAHLDGYIADTARSTVVGGGDSELIKATEDAQREALSMAGPGVMTNEIGRRIEEVIKSYGYTPIRQLSGHTVERYVEHGSKTIPNFHLPHGEPLEVGEAYGLDIFATDGRGNVTESSQVYIYALNKENPFPRLRVAKKLYLFILENYKTLPFTERWFKSKIPGSRLALLEMVKNHALRKYGVLSEAQNALVAQSEHTFVVTENGIEITTESP